MVYWLVIAFSLTISGLSFNIESVESSIIMTELFFDTYDWELKPQEKINHDKKVTAVPAGQYNAPYNWSHWNSYYVVDDNNHLWDQVFYIEKLFEILSKDSIIDALNIQDCTGSRNIKTAKEEDWDYDLGEIKTECLVKYHKQKTYSDCFQREQIHHSVGSIVGVRILNYKDLESKYQYRCKTLDKYWDYFPDNLFTGSVTQYGIKVAEIKNGDMFWGSSSIGWTEVQICNDAKNFPLVPDLPDRQVWVRLVGIDRDIASKVGFSSYFHVKVDDLIPLDQPKPEDKPWQKDVRKLYDEARGL